MNGITFVSGKTPNLPQKDNDFETKNGKFKRPMRIHFRARYSFTLHEFYRKAQACMHYNHSSNLQEFNSASRDVASFEIRPRSFQRVGKDFSAYRITLRRKRIEQSNDRYCLVTITVSYRK